MYYSLCITGIYIYVYIYLTRLFGMTQLFFFLALLDFLLVCLFKVLDGVCIFLGAPSEDINEQYPLRIK